MRLIVLLLWALWATPALADELVVLTHNLQGQTELVDGELRGKPNAGKRAFNLEVVREMMRRLARPTHIREVPFKRGLVRVQQGPHTAFFNVSRTPKRERTVKWVGPLQTETDYFYERRNRPTGVRTLADAKRVTAICVLTGGIHHDVLIKHGFDNVVANTSYINCFKMLNSGRVDLTPSASSTVDAKLEKAGIEAGLIVQTPVVLATSGGYVAFSKDVSDAEIAQWQRAFDALTADGTYAALYNRYFIKRSPEPAASRGAVSVIRRNANAAPSISPNR